MTLWTTFFGRYCKRHDRRYRSDLCPPCTREWLVKTERHDARVKANASKAWPIKRATR